MEGEPRYRLIVKEATQTFGIRVWANSGRQAISIRDDALSRISGAAHDRGGSSRGPFAHALLSQESELRGGRA